MFFICVHCTDLFQQWHHEQNISTDKLEDVQQHTKPNKAKRFIRLADESPLRCVESDEPEYNSYNEHETGMFTRYIFTSL